MEPADSVCPTSSGVRCWPFGLLSPAPWRSRLSASAINALVLVNPALAADLLRFYWFRLTDVALPLGVALEGIALIACSDRQPLAGRQHGAARVAANSRGPTARGYSAAIAAGRWPPAIGCSL